MRINLKTHMLKSNEGLTLIELLIAMVISAILIAAIYRTFIRQQKTYTVQEQVVDMQQNVRVAINRMMREIRMAGFGNVRDVLSLAGGVNSFNQVITPNSNKITIVGAFRQAKRDNGDPVFVQAVGKDAGKDTLVLDYAPDDDLHLDQEKHHFISVDGLESNIVLSRNQNVLVLALPLQRVPRTGAPIFKILAITYDLGTSNGKPVLGRDENTDGGLQPLAENIENIEFSYFDANENPTANPPDIRMIKVTVTARTNMEDPEYKGGAGGFRRRTITSNIHVRNMGLNP